MKKEIYVAPKVNMTEVYSEGVLCSSTEEENAGWLGSNVWGDPSEDTIY